MSARNQGCGPWCSLALQGQVEARGAARLGHGHHAHKHDRTERGLRALEYVVKTRITHRGHICGHTPLVVMVSPCACADVMGVYTDMFTLRTKWKQEGGKQEKGSR